MSHPMKKNICAFLALVFLSLLLGGCSHLSVKHLNRRPWVLEAGQELKMKYLRFEFQVLPMKDRFGVRGTAYPLDVIPGWGEWIRDLWLEAYLSDADGRVMARDLHVYLPKKLDYEKGLEFEFILKPEELGSGGELFITFGYRMVLSDYQYSGTEDKGGITNGPMVFRAFEKAVSRF